MISAFFPSRVISAIFALGCFNYFPLLQLFQLLFILPSVFSACSLPLPRHPFFLQLLVLQPIQLFWPWAVWGSLFYTFSVQPLQPITRNFSSSVISLVCTCKPMKGNGMLVNNLSKHGLIWSLLFNIKVGLTFEPSPAWHLPYWGGVLQLLSFRIPLEDDGICSPPYLGQYHIVKGGSKVVKLFGNNGNCIVISQSVTTQLASTRDNFLLSEVNFIILTTLYYRRGLFTSFWHFQDISFTSGHLVFPWHRMKPYSDFTGNKVDIEITSKEEFRIQKIILSRAENGNSSLCCQLNK